MIIMAYEIKNKKNISTIGVHAGQEEVDETGSRVTPIYQTTSYVFESSEQAANRFALKEGGNIYTRLTNPTTEAFEKRMAAIEGGTAAYATASGMAAIFYAIINLTSVGDNIVSADNLYGGTYELFENTLEELGRTVTFVDSQSPELFEKAIDDRTRAIYVESIGNPKLDIPDFDKLAEIAHSHDIPLIADNTVGIGSVRPFDHGADIIASSDDRATWFVNLRIQGQTLEQVSETAGGLTRERIRQIESKFMRTLFSRYGRLDDDKYQHLYKAYELPDEFIKKYLCFSKQTLYYLEYKYKGFAKKNPLEKALTDSEIPQSIKKQINKYILSQKLLIGNEFVDAKIHLVEDALFPIFCKETISVSQFFERYNSFVVDNHHEELRLEADGLKGRINRYSTDKKLSVSSIPC